MSDPGSSGVPKRRRRRWSQLSPFSSYQVQSSSRQWAGPQSSSLGPVYVSLPHVVPASCLKPVGPARDLLSVPQRASPTDVTSQKREGGEEGFWFSGPWMEVPGLGTDPGGRQGPARAGLHPGPGRRAPVSSATLALITSGRAGKRLTACPSTGLLLYVTSHRRGGRGAPVPTMFLQAARTQGEPGGASTAPVQAGEKAPKEHWPNSGPAARILGRDAEEGGGWWGEV
ncbi:hypothetical protein NDU88_002139 [Pleurodeles waltl]|uniref:Uncharacterized protein n=1 Tax=Pleurodeles waltl TaxID=8319 RepID=A0AAV7MLU9_PLEWA|nr:hypothetical protein NDU88_002139 [Pleurodeles waltl]